MDVIWLIPLLPGLGAAVNGVVGIRFFSRRAAAALACSTMGLAVILAILAVTELVGSGQPEHLVTIGDWIPPIPLQTVDGIGRFHVPWAFRLDPLAGMMTLVVTVIGFLIHVYSVAYMEDEPRGAYARFFCYLNLFCFFMLMLVLGSNFLVMFVGWEGVGLCSYLLIGYWYEKKTASDAGKKAFIVNRIGDWGFVLGLVLVFFTFGTLDFRDVANAASTMPVEAAAFGTLSLMTLLLFIGAMGKSAQIPLYVWLPDAMEGPTPVSALIHAATMVTAGVYMVCRNAVLFSHAPQVMLIVAVIGAVTALMAASIGLVQTDVKRVLAYSTVSQLGYMFLAAGVGAYAAGAFHLMTHAFFKALLFLGSGAVIHAMAGEQDMRRMGALGPYMPITFATMMIGTLAIAGIPPFAGFFSKDEILAAAFHQNRLLWTIAVITAGMTAFYMFRLMSLTFLGAYRGPVWAQPDGASEAAVHGMPHPSDVHAHGQAERPEHEVTHGPAHPDRGHGHGHWHGPHEASAFMTVPLIVLACGAIIAGFVGVPAALGGSNRIHKFLEPSFTAGVHHEAATGAEGASIGPAGEQGASPAASASSQAAGDAHLPASVEWALMAFSVLVALAGIGLAYRNYVKQPAISERWAASGATAHRVLTNKYYVDELYDATVVTGTLSSARGLWTFDRGVVDGAVNGSGWFTIFTSWVSHMFDKYIVDGLVNLAGGVIEDSSFMFRRLQTGLVQNYALLMLFGVGLFAFVSLYLFIR
ncbi:MAG: NADH-quinone oxidoreductase subunit L [Acidobacteria bacterium]|nr:NADH-quinone oxidoreductase subunit L [Acidobacteriota bacterium]